MLPRLKPAITNRETDMLLEVARDYTVPIDVAAWITSNSAGPPSEGAIPVWDGEKLIWSATVIGPPNNWVIQNGFWDDNGVWDDNQIWSDT